MTVPRKPAKPWRAIAGGVPADFTSEKKTYDHINHLASIGGASLGLRITVEHWEDGRWVLYERAVITENGWESA
jgi:hypothetical protein